MEKQFVPYEQSLKLKELGITSVTFDNRYTVEEENINRILTSL